MHQDNWSLKAKKMGYRSRAVFKLEEILLKLHKNQINKVLDLGSAPGGWSQFIINKYPHSKIIAVDILLINGTGRTDFQNGSSKDASR